MRLCLGPSSKRFPERDDGQLQAVVVESSGPFDPLWDELMDEAERLLHEP